MEKDRESAERVYESAGNEKTEKRKQARQERPRSSHQGPSKTPVAMYLISRILAANSLGCVSPATNDYQAYLTSALDQVGNIIDSNRLAEMRRQMVICWNEGWHLSSPSKIMLRKNKSKVPLGMEFGWLNTNDENRSKKKLYVAEKSESCIKHDLIVDNNVNNDKQVFFVYGGNGAHIVEEHLKSKGWTRTMDVRGCYNLKWVENRTQIKYKEFREGVQMVNHIPSTWRLSNKIQLVGLLKELEAHQRPGLLKLTEVIPETYRLNLAEEQFKFKQSYRDGDVWICKPAALNQGKGIYLIRKLSDFNPRSANSAHVPRLFHVGGNRIVQRYIKNPLLLNGRKADIRCFMLISSTSPFLILSHPGYVRLSCRPYDVESDEMGIHLTNQFVQKKDACYSFMKDDTIWSIDQLNAYMNHYVLSYHDLASDWVLNVMITQIRRLMLHCFLAAKKHLESKVGFFELLGFDFVIDAKLKVWLLEVNVNPSFCTDCKVLRDLIPPLLRETLDICIECFEKNQQRMPLMPVKSIKRFTLLYCGERNYPWPTPTSSSTKIKSK